MTNNTLAERIQRADWWHDYSDDSRVRQRGEEQCKAIRTEIREIAKSDPKGAEHFWALVRTTMHGKG